MKRKKRTLREPRSIDDSIPLIVYEIFFDAGGASCERRKIYEYAPVKIGNCCFIGTHAIITKGVAIGEHCLVAAGAVVTKDMPALSIIGGVPAKIIGRVAIDSNNAVTLQYD